jgi:GntR family transcriptional regulator of vanillate catabolism
VHLNENDLAETLKVSRTPVRAALSILATEGLLHYTPNSGFIVRTFTAKDIDAIYEMRATITGLAARLAAQNGLGEERLSRLHLVIAKSKQLIEQGKWSNETIQEWQVCNEAFHSQIISAADSPHLEAVVLRLRDIPVLKEIRYHWMDQETLLRNHQSHADILDAIWRGQQSRAEYLMREHVYQNGQRLVRQWRQAEMRDSASSGEAQPKKETQGDRLIGAAPVATH